MKAARMRVAMTLEGMDRTSGKYGSSISTATVAPNSSENRNTIEKQAGRTSEIQRRDQYSRQANKEADELP